jgi:hypothetical protein
MLLALLKQRLQPERVGASWRQSITSSRIEIRAKIKDSPSLKRYLDGNLTSIYRGAVKDALYEMQLPRAHATKIPAECPWQLDELLEGEPG